MNTDECDNDPCPRREHAVTLEPSPEESDTLK
jgi:hypothetical protein